MHEPSEPLREKDNVPEPTPSVPPSPELTVPPAPTPPTPPTPPEGFVPKEDLEALQKRYNESGSEALAQKARADQAERQLQDLTKEPTEPELRQAFPDWDLMSDSEKRSSRMAFDAQRTALATKADLDARRAREEREGSVEAALTSHSELEGKETAFRTFCAQPTHKSVDPEILVAAFLHKTGTTPPAPATPPAPGLEPGNGGPREPGKSTKVSLEEAKTIRETNYPRYLELVKSGQIDTGL